MVGLLQPQLRAIMITSVSNGRLSRSSDPRVFCCGSIGIAQRIARTADRVLNLSADIALGVNQQLSVANSTDLTDAGYRRTAVSTLRAQAAQSMPSTCQL